MAAAAVTTIASRLPPSSLLHARFAHYKLSPAVAGAMGNTALSKHASQCPVCIQSHSIHKQTGRINYHPPTAALEVMFGDLMGPMSLPAAFGIKRQPSLGGSLYVLVLVDGYTKYVWVVTIQRKGDTAEHVLAIIRAVQVATGRTLKRFHSDGGGEFESNVLKNFLRENGTVKTTTTADHPQHNGVVERMNRSLQELTTAALSHCGASQVLWGDAIVHAARVLNFVPTVKRLQSPHYLLYGTEPNSKAIRVFGCDANPMVARRGKFEPRTTRGILIGYDDQHRAYRVLLHTDEANKAFVVSTVDPHLNELSFEYLRSSSYRSRHFVSSLPLQVNHIMPGSMQIEGGLSKDSSIRTAQVTLEEDDSNEQQSDTTRSYNGPTCEAISMDTTRSCDSPRHRAAAVDVTTTTGVLPSVPTPSTPFIRTTEIPNDVRVTTQQHRQRSGHVRFADGIEVGCSAVYEKDPMYYVCSIAETDTDPTYKQAMMGKDKEHWQQAIDREYNSLREKGVYSIVTPPKGARIVGSKLVLKVKLDKDNRPIKYKARAVAQGFSQVEGVNYFDTYSPVAKVKSIKLAISLAAQDRNLSLFQIDFDTAFLNAELREEVYMRPPPGMHVERGQVLLLHKALYGLKQSNHEWNSTIHNKLVSLSYTRLKCDTCVYIKRTKESDTPIILVLYVDDTITVVPKQLIHVWKADQSAIAESFAITGGGECTWILNMAVTRQSDGTITLSQSAYVKLLLEKFNMTDCKPVSIPAIAGVDLSVVVDTTTGAVLCSADEHATYRSMVGGLSYAAITTRLDIAYITSVLARFVNAPLTQHLDAAKHVLRYLSGTVDQCMTFGQFRNRDLSTVRLEVYTDSDYAQERADRKSITGVVMLVNGDVISTVSKKQKTVSCSSTESEYVAAGAGVRELLWYRSWFSEIFGLDRRITGVLWIDNLSAKSLCTNDGSHGGTKHIDVQHHFIRDHVLNGIIRVRHVPTSEQLADIMTKPLARPTFTSLRDCLLTTPSAHSDTHTRSITLASCLDMPIHLQLFTH